MGRPVSQISSLAILTVVFPLIVDIEILVQPVIATIYRQQKALQLVLLLLRFSLDWFWSFSSYIRSIPPKHVLWALFSVYFRWFSFFWPSYSFSRHWFLLAVIYHETWWIWCELQSLVVRILRKVIKILRSGQWKLTPLSYKSILWIIKNSTQQEKTFFLLLWCWNRSQCYFLVANNKTAEKHSPSAKVIQYFVYFRHPLGRSSTNHPRLV